MWKREHENKLKKWDVSKITVKLMLEECVGEEVKGMLQTKSGLEGWVELKNTFQMKDHIESTFKLKRLVRNKYNSDPELFTWLSDLKQFFNEINQNDHRSLACSHCHLVTDHPLLNPLILL